MRHGWGMWWRGCARNAETSKWATVSRDAHACLRRSVWIAGTEGVLSDSGIGSGVRMNGAADALRYGTC
jgi:hypothetical protein